jgi:phage terminase large subunit-like protein
MEELARLSPEVQARWLAEQPVHVLEQMARREWWWIGRPEQQTPAGKWFVWLIQTGRGWGKTQTGAEWIVDRAIRYPLDLTGRPTEHLLIAETLTDAMRQCIGGPAGVRRVLERRLGSESRYTDGRDGGAWHLIKSPKPFIEIFDHHQVIYIEGADDEDVGRGYNAASAWLDEFAKWKKPDGSWTEGIMPGLRADIPGDFPRALITTTPKLVVQLVEWQGRADGSVHLTRGSTYENAGNLAAPALAELHKRYAGTRLGRQELGGELIMEAEGALWGLGMIEPYRAARPPELVNVVVGMDPPGADDPTSDECGLIAAGKGIDDRDYVLGDWSKRIVGHAAARRAWTMVIEYGASVLIVEDNQGKRWLRRGAGPGLPRDAGRGAVSTWRQPAGQDGHRQDRQAAARRAGRRTLRAGLRLPRARPEPRQPGDPDGQLGARGDRQEPGPYRRARVRPAVADFAGQDVRHHGEPGQGAATRAHLAGSARRAVARLPGLGFRQASRRCQLGRSRLPQDQRSPTDAAARAPTIHRGMWG